MRYISWQAKDRRDSIEPGSLLSNRFKELLYNILASIIPRANPDFEKIYIFVVYWWLELNDAGVPQREIGFDQSKTPIVFGPIGENMGLLTDSNLVLSEAENQNEIANEFEPVWCQLVAEFGGTA